MRLASCCLFAGALLLGGCRDASDSEASDGDSGSSSSKKKSGKSEQSAKPDEAPLIVTDEVVRLAGGRVILLLPELPSGWTIVHKHNAMLSGVQLFRGTPKDFTAFVTLVFAPSARNRDVAKFHAEHAESLRLAPLVASAAPAPIDISGGLANEWTGTNEYGVAERAWVAVVVQETEAVSMLARSSSQLYDPEVLPLAKTLLANLRLASNVPRLSDNKPSERLDGIWEYKRGLQTDWMTFDPRGYAHMGSPDDPASIDFDVRLALGQSVYKYQIAGGKLVLERFPPNPDDVVRNWAFAHQGDALSISEQEYRRVDDAKVDLQPGKWEFYASYDTGNAFTGSTGIAVDESIYVLAADGTYTYTGGFSYSHTELDVGNPGEIDWTAAGYAAPEPAKGKWKLDGNTLVLDDGKVVAKRTVFPSKHAPGKIAYISGRMFVKKD